MRSSAGATTSSARPRRPRARSRLFLRAAPIPAVSGSTMQSSAGATTSSGNPRHRRVHSGPCRQAARPVPSASMTLWFAGAAEKVARPRRLLGRSSPCRREAIIPAASGWVALSPAGGPQSCPRYYFKPRRCRPLGSSSPCLLGAGMPAGSASGVLWSAGGGGRPWNLEMPTEGFKTISAGSRAHLRHHRERRRRLLGGGRGHAPRPAAGAVQGCICRHCAHLWHPRRRHGGLLGPQRLRGDRLAGQGHSSPYPLGAATHVASAPTTPSSAGATTNSDRPHRRQSRSRPWRQAAPTPAASAPTAPLPAGATTRTAKPAPPLGTFTAISGGDFHSCAIRSDSAVVCWGENAFGRAESPPGEFAAVSAGGVHSCAIRGDGTVACWGHNYFGQIEPPPGEFAAVSGRGPPFLRHPSRRHR